MLPNNAQKRRRGNVRNVSTSENVSTSKNVSTSGQVASVLRDRHPARVDFALGAASANVPTWKRFGNAKRLHVGTFPRQNVSTSARPWPLWSPRVCQCRRGNVFDVETFCTEKTFPRPTSSAASRFRGGKMRARFPCPKRFHVEAARRQRGNVSNVETFPTWKRSDVETLSTWKRFCRGNV